MEHEVTIPASTARELRSNGDRLAAMKGRAEELERVLRDVLRVIDAMQAPAETGEAFPGDEDDDDYNLHINDQHCFGAFENYGITNIDGPDMSRPVVIEWPDLAWAKDQIVKVLGS